MTERMAQMAVVEEQGQMGTAACQQLPPAPRRVQVDAVLAMEVESETEFRLKVNRRQRGAAKARQVRQAAPDLATFPTEQGVGGPPEAAAGVVSPPSASRL
jgi:hypothetical protein